MSQVGTTPVSMERLLSLLSKHSLTETKFQELTQMPYFARKQRIESQEEVLASASSESEKVKSSGMEGRKQDEYIFVSDKDKLFWYLMMIVNKWEIADLPEPKERFYFERDEKTRAVELLQKSTDIHWKELKLPKTDICTNLACGSRRPVTLSEFVALCHLYEKNVLLHWGKCYYKINGGFTGADQTWYIIVRTKGGDKLVAEHVRDSRNENIVNTCFHVKSLDKHLGTESSYKLNELEGIANKFGISILKENGKKMKKSEIYNLLLNETQKID